MSSTELELEARRRRTEELKALGFSPSNPAHRIAVQIADELGLNLLLKQLVVIPGKGAYITRDGLLAVAHKDGNLNGIVLEEQGKDDTHWYAIVSVYRKDMQYPFRYPGRYPFNGSNAAYGPEMAIKVAESMALRRAFVVTGVASADEAYDVEPEIADSPDDPELSAEMMPDGIVEDNDREESY